jgi:cyclic AMP-dependent transcription factor ATF-6 alpha
MNTVEFDYDAFLDGLESASTLSTTSPTTTENDTDSGIAYTPPMPMGLDDTVIDFDALDFLPLPMESPLSDDPNDEFNLFSSALFDGKNPLMPGDDCTFQTLFSDIDLFEQQNQEPSQQIPSIPSPVLSTKSPDVIPSINNCIKLQSCSNTASIGPKCIKLEPRNPNITIIQTSKPITLTNVPVLTMPLTTNDSITTSSAKRRRADSPINHRQISEMPTITLDQLKLQYKNLSEEGLKKHLRMIKNRESASLSRKRRKELMENLDVKVKDLTDENEQLKRENSKLLTRIHTLEMENELLKKYRQPNGPFPQARKPLILMGVILLVVFNVFTLKSLAPISNDPSGSLALYNNDGAVVPGRTILSDRRSNSYLASNEHDYGPDNNPSVIPSYPFIQCVAYINKTHSQRINQDLHSWVQDNDKKQHDTQPNIIPDPKSLTIPSTSVLTDSSVAPIQHKTRKVARQTKIQSENKGQLQPYKTYEANYEDFIQTIDRKNDTLYFVSFKRDHLIFPATAQNQTQRPKMSLILPASMANLNKSIHVPINHVPMLKIDCEVEDTKLVFVKRSHVPLSYQNDLFQYYSSVPQASI